MINIKTNLCLVQIKCNLTPQKPFGNIPQQILDQIGWRSETSYCLYFREGSLGKVTDLNAYSSLSQGISGESAERVTARPEMVDLPRPFPTTRGSADGKLHGPNEQRRLFYSCKQYSIYLYFGSTDLYLIFW